MPDYMARAIGANGNIRLFAATTTDLANIARRRHDTWPTATAALGRTLTGACLLSATLKDPSESITLRFAADGPIGGITCDADEQGQVRGFVKNPHVDAEPKHGKLDVAAVVGRGYVHLTRYLRFEGTYTGTSEIVSGEIAEDLAYYLTKSEQTPSAVALGVRVAPDGAVTASGGYMVQLMPATSEEEREQLEVNIRALGAVSQAVEQGLSPEDVIASVMAGLDYKILETRDLHFACRCNRERALGIMSSIAPADLEQMIREDKGAEMTCQFCGEIYHFSDEELLSVHRSPGEGELN